MAGRNAREGVRNTLLSVRTADEILTLVHVALGNADATACPNGIPSGAQVDVALILTAVNNALSGCGEAARTYL